LARDISQVLRNYGSSLNLAVDRAAKVVGDNVKKELKATSPKGYRGKYRAGWYVKTLKSGSVVVANKEYRLTHLLEHGHVTRYKTGKYGQKRTAKAEPHIGPASAKVEQEFIEEINKQLNFK
jgi:hypothetical protein